MTIADVSLAGQVVLASEFIRRTRWGRMRERIVGAERMKGVVRITLRNMDDMFRQANADLQVVAARCEYDVQAAYPSRLKRSFLRSIIYATMEWWLDHRKPL